VLWAFWEHSTVEHSDYTIPEDKLDFAPTDEWGNELPPDDLVRINQLSWQKRVEIYRQLARERKDRVEQQCKRWYKIYWLEREHLASEFIRCSWCTGRRKQAVVYCAAPYYHYFCLDCFHAWDKQRKKTKQYKKWAAKKKAQREQDELEARLSRGV
jgi:hypothetical protein